MLHARFVLTIFTGGRALRPWARLVLVRLGCLPVPPSFPPSPLSLCTLFPPFLPSLVSPYRYCKGYNLVTPVFLSILLSLDIFPSLLSILSLSIIFFFFFLPCSSSWYFPSLPLLSLHLSYFPFFSCSFIIFSPSSTSSLSLCCFLHVFPSFLSYLSINLFSLFSLPSFSYFSPLSPCKQIYDEVNKEENEVNKGWI